MSLVLFAFACKCSAQKRKHQKAASIQSHWKSKKIAFLGDSITDKRHVGTKKNYWQFLQESLGIIPYVYGINGHTFKNLPAQAQLLKKEHGNDIDAILIFAGTNDFNGGIKPGDWYKIQDTKVDVANKKTEIRKRRILDMNDATFRGRINIVMAYLKQNFPDTQIILFPHSSRLCDFLRIKRPTRRILPQQKRILYRRLHRRRQGNSQRLVGSHNRPKRDLRIKPNA